MPQDQEQNSAMWPQDMQDDPMSAAVGDDDFSKFLEIEPNFHFTNLDNAQSGLDTPMERLGFDQSTHQSVMHSLSFQQQHQLLDMDLALAGNHQDFAHQIPTTQNFEPFQQYHHMQMGHNYHVPPTPVSSEMHASKYGQHMDNAGQILFDRHQVSFTPLVSPAQTPLTGAFSLPEYGNADDFFSPLTSPALEAQLGQSSTGPSPIDMTEAVSKSAAPSKRGRRKGSITTRAQARSVKQSPATKPVTRRKGASTSNLHAEKVDAVMQRNQTLQAHTLPNAIRNIDDSVSPESLSEALMRPPPLPQGTDRSPMVLPSTGSSSAVTPATLMMIQKKGQRTPGSGAIREEMTESNEPMEDIALPAAAAPVTSSTGLHIDISRQSEDDQSTPTLSAKSAKISATSTPRSAFARMTPQESSKSKTESKTGGRGNKKRQSTSSAAISPALRPKISPSIPPLAPAAGPGMPHVSAETSALYLASKSNYQNIIDGTHLPGVSYPEALAENLSSKRTSHKIAEQGRRNRINLALKEIESLLPPAMVSGGSKRDHSTASPDANGGDKSAAAMQGGSKANTVELAIVYIKNLQAELKVTQDKLEGAEKRLAEGNSSAESQASD